MMVMCIYELRMRTWVYVVPLLCYSYVRVASGDPRMGLLVGVVRRDGTCVEASVNKMRMLLGRKTTLFDGILCLGFEDVGNRLVALQYLTYIVQTDLIGCGTKGAKGLFASWRWASVVTLGLEELVTLSILR